MKLLYKKRRLYLNLAIGIVWIILFILKLLYTEPHNIWLLDYYMPVLSGLYLLQFLYQYHYQYLIVTDTEIIRNHLFFGKKIPLNAVERFYTNNLGDYVIEGSGKKIKINPIIVNQKSLQEFKGFTRTLSIATEIH